MPLAQGQILNNRYRIVKLLGQGGFGAVYRAWDTNLNIACAVKENFEASLEAQRQFSREATLLANLNHHNLPRVTDHFIISGQGQYLVMDFIEGEDLQTKLDNLNSPIPTAGALSWIEQVCAALTYLHAQNPPIIHRDIKPANIIVTSHGQAVLVDFSIAKVFDPVLRTTTGARAVTPGYSPPEQYGQGRTDSRTDIYALGATLYTLLTSQAPPESVMRIANDPLIDPIQLNPHLSPAIASALRRSLSLDPQQRFDSATDFADTFRGNIVPFQIVSAGATLNANVAAPVTSPQLLGGVAVVAMVVIMSLFVAAVIYAALVFLNLNNRNLASPTAIGSTAISLATDNPTATTITRFTPTAIRTQRPARTPRPTQSPTTSLPSLHTHFSAIRFCTDKTCSRFTTTFPQGIKALYYQWDYEDMEPGMNYGRKWYVNGGLYLDYDCTWGSSWPSDGVFSKIVFDNTYGLAPGTWEIESYVEGELQSTASFTVEGPIRYEAFLDDYHCNDQSPSP